MFIPGQTLNGGRVDGDKPCVVDELTVLHQVLKPAVAASPLARFSLLMASAIASATTVHTPRFALKRWGSGCAIYYTASAMEKGLGYRWEIDTVERYTEQERHKAVEQHTAQQEKRRMRLRTGCARRIERRQTCFCKVFPCEEKKKKKWVSVRALVEGSTRELKAVFPSPHGAATFLYSIAGLEWFAAT